MTFYDLYIATIGSAVVKKVRRRSWPEDLKIEIPLHNIAIQDIPLFYSQLNSFKLTIVDLYAKDWEWVKFCEECFREL